jgi:hypothetical protein
MRTVFVTNVRPTGRERTDTPATNSAYPVRALPPPTINWGEERSETSRPAHNAFLSVRRQDAAEIDRNRPVSALPAPAWNFGTR